MTTHFQHVFGTYVSTKTFTKYAEYDSVHIYGRYGIKKFRHGIYTKLVFSNSCVLLSPISLFYKEFKSKKYLLWAYLSDCLYSTNFGQLMKYRMKGLGHRIYRKKSTFLYKLGYSHDIYKSLDLNIVHSPKRHKKKPFLAMRSIDSTNMNTSLHTIQMFRVPNCYCGNGFFIRGLVVESRQGKKGFML